MPTAGATVEEAILDEMVTTLDAIVTSSAYNFNYKVRRQERNAQTLKMLPALIVVHMGTEQEDIRLGLIQCVMTVDVVGGIRASKGDWQGDLSLVISDIANGLRADYTRGGNAVTTRITNTEVYDSTESGSGNIVACQVTAEIVFRHLYGDTTSAI